MSEKITKPQAGIDQSKRQETDYKDHHTIIQIEDNEQLINSGQQDQSSMLKLMLKKEQKIKEIKKFIQQQLNYNLFEMKRQINGGLYLKLWSYNLQETIKQFNKNRQWEKKFNKLLKSITNNISPEDKELITELDLKYLDIRNLKDYQQIQLFMTFPKLQTIKQKDCSWFGQIQVVKKRDEYKIDLDEIQVKKWMNQKHEGQLRSIIQTRIRQKNQLIKYKLFELFFFESSQKQDNQYYQKEFQDSLKKLQEIPKQYRQLITKLNLRQTSITCQQLLELYRLLPNIQQLDLTGCKNIKKINGIESCRIQNNESANQRSQASFNYFQSQSKIYKAKQLLQMIQLYYEFKKIMLQRLPILNLVVNSQVIMNETWNRVLKYQKQRNRKYLCQNLQFQYQRYPNHLTFKDQNQFKINESENNLIYFLTKQYLIFMDNEKRKNQKNKNLGFNQKKMEEDEVLYQKHRNYLKKQFRKQSKSFAKSNRLLKQFIQAFTQLKKQHIQSLRKGSNPQSSSTKNVCNQLQKEILDFEKNSTEYNIFLMEQARFDITFKENQYAIMNANSQQQKSKLLSKFQQLVLLKTEVQLKYLECLNQYQELGKTMTQSQKYSSKFPRKRSNQQPNSIKNILRVSNEKQKTIFKWVALQIESNRRKQRKKNNNYSKQINNYLQQQIQTFEKNFTEYKISLCAQAGFDTTFQETQQKTKSQLFLQEREKIALEVPFAKITCQIQKKFSHINLGNNNLKKDLKNYPQISSKKKQWKEQQNSLYKQVAFQELKKNQSLLKFIQQILKHFYLKYLVDVFLNAENHYLQKIQCQQFYKDTSKVKMSQLLQLPGLPLVHRNNNRKITCMMFNGLFRQQSPQEQLDNFSKVLIQQVTYNDPPIQTELQGQDIKNLLTKLQIVTFEHQQQNKKEESNQSLKDVQNKKKELLKKLVKK